MRKNIYIVGAGNIGSRHLQALKAVGIPLNIKVIDPNQNSLTIAKKRYYSVVNTKQEHRIAFYESIPQRNEHIDLAIISTNSDVRKLVIESLLKQNDIKNFVIEKILFQKRKDYEIIEDLLKKNKCNAWVNCYTREMPGYCDRIKKMFNQKILILNVYGSNWGLISNIIHFIDYLSYLIEINDFYIDTSYLDPTLLKSKRKGFFELMGILQAHYKDGSHGFFSCFSTGNLPIIIEITSDEAKCIIHQAEEKAWIYTNSKVEVLDIKNIPLSVIMTKIYEDILIKNKCSLPSFGESKKMHLIILDSVIAHLNNNSGQQDSLFQFT